MTRLLFICPWLTACATTGGQAPSVADKFGDYVVGAGMVGLEIFIAIGGGL